MHRSYSKEEKPWAVPAGLGGKNGIESAKLIKSPTTQQQLFERMQTSIQKDI